MQSEAQARLVTKMYMEVLRGNKHSDQENKDCTHDYIF